MKMCIIVSREEIQNSWINLILKIRERKRDISVCLKFFLRFWLNELAYI